MKRTKTVVNAFEYRIVKIQGANYVYVYLGDLSPVNMVAVFETYRKAKNFVKGKLLARLEKAFEAPEVVALD